MRVLLISVGSRGDVEPFCALAQELMDAGHDVDYAVQQDSIGLVPKGVVIHALPFGTNDFYKYATTTTTTTTTTTSANNNNNDNENATNGNVNNPRVRFVGIIANVIGELVLPCWKQVLNVAYSCDAIVCSSLARSLAFAVMEKVMSTRRKGGDGDDGSDGRCRLLPTYLLHLQPMMPTSLFPHYSQTAKCIQCLLSLLKKKKKNDNDVATTTTETTDAEYNLESYWELERYQFVFLQERLDAMLQQEEMNLPPLTFERMQQYLNGNDCMVHLVNAFSHHLIPNNGNNNGNNSNANGNVHNVGALADSYIPRDFIPNQALIDFFNTHNETTTTNATNATKPICIGFGSMPYDAKKVQDLVDIVNELNLSAVFVGKALSSYANNGNNDDNIDKNSRIIHVNSVAYAWLLPRCSLVVCHGGAGVVHTALRAGIPLVVAPLIGDQFLFADLLPAMGLGARAGKSVLTNTTKDEFKHAIVSALEECCCSSSTTTVDGGGGGAAHQLGRELQKEEENSGVKLLVRILQEQHHDQQQQQQQQQQQEYYIDNVASNASKLNKETIACQQRTAIVCICREKTRRRTKIKPKLCREQRSSRGPHCTRNGSNGGSIPESVYRTVRLVCGHEF